MAEMDSFEIVDDRFARYLRPDSRVETLFTGMEWGEGPVWFNDGNYLLFSDIPNNRILRYSEADGVSDWRNPSDFANGNTLDLEGRLITCEHGRRAVSRTNHDGSVELLVDRYEGGRLNSPNDVVVKSDGTIWFTDPEYGIQDDQIGFESPNEQGGKCYVFRFDPASGELSVVADDFIMPNGLAFSADESLLYIVDSGGDRGLDLFSIPDELPDPHEIRVFDVIDGARLVNSRLFTKVSPGVPDGMRLDSDGNVWSVAFDGVHCYSPKAELLGKIKIAEMVANLTFGGPERNRLFIAGATSLYAVDLDCLGIQRP
jgi:gluconolactonase